MPALGPPPASAVVASPNGVLLPSGKFVEVVPSVNTGLPITLNREYLYGVQLAAQTLDRMAISITGTAASAGGVVRLGIRQDIDGTPGASVAEGTVSATTANSTQTLTISYAHPGGTLWVSVTGQGWSVTAPTIDSRAPGTSGAPVGAPLVSGCFRSTIDFAAGHTPFVGFQDGVTGALGSTFTNAANTSQNITTLVLRRA